MSNESSVSVTYEDNRLEINGIIPVPCHHKFRDNFSFRSLINEVVRKAIIEDDDYRHNTINGNTITVTNSDSSIYTITLLALRNKPIAKHIEEIRAQIQKGITLHPDMVVISGRVFNIEFLPVNKNDNVQWIKYHTIVHIFEGV